MYNIPDTSNNKDVVLYTNSNMRTLTAKYLIHWPWFILSTILMIACAYVYLSQQTPIYKIQASLLVENETKANEQSNLLKEFEVISPQKVVENEIEFLHSIPLMLQVVEKHNLNVQYYYKTTLNRKEIYDESPVELFVINGKSNLYTQPLEVAFPDSQKIQINERLYPLNQIIETPYGHLRVKTRTQVNKLTKPITIQVSKPLSIAKEYANNLKAAPINKSSSVILITFEDAIPARGELVLNQIIIAYNKAASLNKNKIAAHTLDFINERLKIISGELTMVEKGVESYKSTRGITDLSVQAGSFLQTAQQNDALLNQVNIQLATLNDLQAYVTSKSNSRGSTPAVVGLNDPVLIGLITNLTQLELQKDKLGRITSEQNPLLETLDNQIKITKNNILENIHTMKAMLLSSQQQYTANNSRLENEIKLIPQKERSLMNITRQQAIKNNLYVYLLQKREEAAVAFSSVISDSRIVNPPQSSDAPIRPVKMIVYTLFGLLGILLPIVVVTGRDTFNDRVVKRADVEEATHIPILGELVKGEKLKSIVIASTTQSIISEQIRTLRANLSSTGNDNTKSQVLLFTSSISGEGKSFVSLNLGISLALISKKTVILDMDLRMPKLHKIFFRNNTIGISNYLEGDATLDQIIRSVPGHLNYYIISSGPLPTNPSELLSHPNLKHLIMELREHFDYILIDTPPIGLVSDAQLIAPHIDNTFFIVRHDVTPKAYLKMLNKLHDEKRFPRLNIILNSVVSNNSYYYNNSYAYGRTIKQ